MDLNLARSKTINLGALQGGGAPKKSPANINFLLKNAIRTTMARKDEVVDNPNALYREPHPLLDKLLIKNDAKSEQIVLETL